VARTPFYKSSFIDGRALNGTFNWTQFDTLFNKSLNLARLIGVMSQFRLQIYPGFEVEDWFIQSTKTLPRTYSNETCAPFWKFFKSYGTHYLNNVLYGGIFTFQFTFNTSIYETETNQWVNNQLPLVYTHFKIIHKFPQVNMTQPVDPLFRKVIKSFNLDVSGGDQMVNGLVRWQKGLPENSSGILERSTVTALYTLIRDANAQMALKLATIDYGNGVPCDLNQTSFH